LLLVVQVVAVAIVLLLALLAQAVVRVVYLQPLDFWLVMALR
jgi:hypothetical protein